MKEHQFPNEVELIKVINTDIATIFFYKNFVVVEFVEGITISYKNGLSLLFNALKIIGTKPFFYISFRKHSYSLVPTDYEYFNRIPNLKALAVVYPNRKKFSTVPLESNFINKPIKEFASLDEAYYWGMQFIKKGKASIEKK